MKKKFLNFAMISAFALSLTSCCNSCDSDPCCPEPCAPPRARMCQPQPPKAYCAPQCGPQYYDNGCG